MALLEIQKKIEPSNRTSFFCLFTCCPVGSQFSQNLEKLNRLRFPNQQCHVFALSGMASLRKFPMSNRQHFSYLSKKKKKTDNILVRAEIL